jgi:hypothetical protein
MRLDVEIYEAGSYLLMKAAGQYSLVDLTGLFDRAGQEAEKRAYAEVLLDLNAVAGAIPVLDMLVLGEHCARVWKRTRKMAIVSGKGGLDRFFEDVSINRGVILAVFPNQAAALAWLMT